MYKNCIRNSSLDLIQKRVFIPAQDLVQSQVTGASTVLDASFGTGAAQYLEVATSGVGAMRFVAAGVDVNYLWVPTDFDNRHRLYIRALWTTDAVGSGGSCVWTVLHRPVQPSTALGIGNTALSRIILTSQKSSVTADVPIWTPYGYIAPQAGGTAAYHTFHPDTVAVNFNLTLTSTTITVATDFVHLLGIELSYTPRLCFGTSDRPARFLKDGLHPTLELDATPDL
ncbi:MAG: hypothetical protein ACRCZI_10400 [Cetobacterium sp.]